MKMNFLFCLDKNYLNNFLITLRSIEDNNLGNFNIYILSKDLKEEDINKSLFKRNHNFMIIKMDDEKFKDAPTSKRYPITIYYRIFAAKFLPKDVDKVLYLDCDIIVKGDLNDLYNMSLDGYCFAASSNVERILTRFNQIKNNAPKDTVYINTGVLLMNLNYLRDVVDENDVYQFLKKKRRVLTLPDQDVLSTLYGDKVKIIDRNIYNLSDRTIVLYNMRHKEKIDDKWVEENTKIIHYYGKNKPWNDDYRGILKKYYDKYNFKHINKEE